MKIPYVKFVVTFAIPDRATVKDAREYIKDAIRSRIWQLPSEEGMFELNRTTIHVSRGRLQVKEVSDRGRRFSIESKDGQHQSREFSLAKLLKGNADDPVCCKWLKESVVGASFYSGGGAAPFIKVTRVR